MAANQTAEEVSRALHSAFLNGRYHADREAFLDRLDRWITFGVLITGAVAFFQLAGANGQKLGAAILSIFAIAQLVFALGEKAKLHSTLRRRYFEVAASIEAGEMNAKKAHAALLRLTAEEGPPYLAVHALAENWATRAVYGDELSIPCRIPYWRKLTRNFLRHESYDFSAD